jgi:hypothetical protein
MSPISLNLKLLADRQKLVDRAYIVKDEGNAAFTSKPPKTELAIEKYQSALKLLPPVPKLVTPATKPLPVQNGSGIQEITDEEAEAIAISETKVLTEREEVEGKIRECAKACHGNLAACWALTKEDKRTIEAANKGRSILLGSSS